MGKHRDGTLVSPPKQTWTGELILIGLTVLWGSSFLIIQDAQRSISAGTLVFLRFTLGACLLTPFLRRDLKLFVAGVELGFWLWAGFLTQAIGLHTTTSSRGAFVTSLNVIFVPMLAALVGRRIPKLVWISAAVALGGAALMCYDNAPATVGDLWVLACAALFAVFIVRLESAAKKFAALPLTGVQLWTVAALSLPWFAHDVYTGVHHVPWLNVIYLGVLCTALTTWLQTVGQRTVPAAQASIIYLLEPVFAAIFAFIFIHERMGWRGIAGSALILGATALSQLPLQKKGSPAAPPRDAFP